MDRTKYMSQSSNHPDTPCIRTRDDERVHTHTHECIDIPTLTRIRTTTTRKIFLLLLQHCAREPCKYILCVTIEYTHTHTLGRDVRSHVKAHGKETVSGKTRVLCDTINTTLIKCIQYLFSYARGWSKGCGGMR